MITTLWIVILLSERTPICERTSIIQVDSFATTLLVLVAIILRLSIVIFLNVCRL